MPRSDGGIYFTFPLLHASGPCGPFKQSLSSYPHSLSGCWVCVLLLRLRRTLAWSMSNILPQIVQCSCLVSFQRRGFPGFNHIGQRHLDQIVNVKTLDIINWFPRELCLILSSVVGISYEGPDCLSTAVGAEPFLREMLSLGWWAS